MPLPPCHSLHATASLLTAFSCTKHRLCDYPNLHGFLHRLLALPGVSNCVDIEGIKLMYHLHKGFHAKAGIFVPLGPDWIDNPNKSLIHKDDQHLLHGIAFAAAGFVLCAGLVRSGVLSLEA